MKLSLYLSVSAVLHLYLTSLLMDNEKPQVSPIALESNSSSIEIEFYEEPKIVPVKKIENIPVKVKRVVRKKVVTPTPRLNKATPKKTVQKQITKTVKTKWVKPADYKRNPAPSYPRVSRRRGEEGTVLVKALVGKKGFPVKTNIHQSSGYKRLDKEALRAVSSWEFSPAEEDGLNIVHEVLIPIKFQIEG